MMRLKGAVGQGFSTLITIKSSSPRGGRDFTSSSGVAFPPEAGKRSLLDFKA
jgi:hypothetical protein